MHDGSLTQKRSSASAAMNLTEGRGPDWFRTGSEWTVLWAVACCAAVLVTIGAVQSVVAQGAKTSVPLRLVNRVDAPGEMIDRSEPLPARTEVVVLPFSGGVSISLLNLRAVSRDSLARRARRRPVQRLDDRGTTPTSYTTTSQSDRVYYVLARTPGGALYESYVNTGTRSDPIFVPGADAVLSGRMTIGPVPTDAQETMGAVFEEDSVLASEAPTEAASADSFSAQNTARGDSAATGNPAPSRDSAGRAATSSRPSGTEGSEERAAETQGPGGFSGWSVFLGGMVGLLFGGLLGWMGQRYRLRTEREDRAARASTSQREAPQEEAPDVHRRVTNINVPADARDEVSEVHRNEQDVTRLREANEELYAENRELKRRLQKVKRFVGRIRDQRSETGASDDSVPSSSASSPSLESEPEDDAEESDVDS